jgi:hypothetical protein
VIRPSVSSQTQRTRRPLHTDRVGGPPHGSELREQCSVITRRIKIPRVVARPAWPTAEQEDPKSVFYAGLRRFGSGWQCASQRGTASRGTSSKDLRASPGGRRLHTRIPSSWIAEASAGIRCPSHNRDSVRSLLTFFLDLLRSRPAHWMKLDDRRSSDRGDQRGGTVKFPSLLE